MMKIWSNYNIMEIKNALDIKHHSKGSGLSIINDTTATAGKDNVLVYQNSVSTSNKSQAGGRGVSIMVPQANNNKPALEGGTLGIGHGLFGQSGFDSWGLVQALPVAGVMGYSGTNGAPLGNGNSSGGSMEPGLGTTLIRARIGVAGFSYKNHGLLGATYINGGYNGNNPDSIVASVRGTGEFFEPTSGNVTAFDLFRSRGYNAGSRKWSNRDRGRSWGHRPLRNQRGCYYGRRMGQYPGPGLEHSQKWLFTGEFNNEQRKGRCSGNLPQTG
jgi:hypothetical protein